MENSTHQINKTKTEFVLFRAKDDLFSGADVRRQQFVQAQKDRLDYCRHLWRHLDKMNILNFDCAVFQKISL